MFDVDDCGNVLLFCSSPGVDTTSSSQSFASRELPCLTTCSYLYLDNPQLECMSVIPTAAATDRNASLTTHCLVPLSQISPTRSAAAPSSLWPSRPVIPSAAQQEVSCLSRGRRSHTPGAGSQGFPYTRFSYVGPCERGIGPGGFLFNISIQFKVKFFEQMNCNFVTKVDCGWTQLPTVTSKLLKLLHLMRFTHSHRETGENTLPDLCAEPFNFILNISTLIS